MFSISGYAWVAPSVARAASIVWWEPEGRRFIRNAPAAGIARGLDGDSDLVSRAILDEIEGRRFRATPTGPVFVADLDDERAALVQLRSYFLAGYRLDGKPPLLVFPVGEGAVA